jgi:hypothetical protein
MISSTTMKNAISIGNYFLEHAQVVYRLMGADKQTVDARYILHQLEKGQYTEITRTELTRLCRGHFTTAEEMSPALELLEEYGYIHANKTNIGYNNRTQISYHVNPRAYSTISNSQACGIDGNDGIDEREAGENLTNPTISDSQTYGNDGIDGNDERDACMDSADISGNEVIQSTFRIFTGDLRKGRI